MQATKATTKAQATATKAAAAAPATQAAPVLQVTAKAHAVIAKAGQNTKQRGTQRLGKAWHTGAVAKPNTRAAALAAIAAALPQGGTLAQCQAALAPLHAQGVLGSGTPRSYCVAFVAAGYLA